MDSLTLAKIQNIINEIENQLSKPYIDSSVSVTLMEISLNRFRLLMTHIGFLEARIEELIAENQRLQQIAKY